MRQGMAWAELLAVNGQRCLRAVPERLQWPRDLHRRRMRVPSTVGGRNGLFSRTGVDGGVLSVLLVHVREEVQTLLDER